MRRFSCDFAWRHENQKRRDDAFRGLSECRANGAFSDVLREDVWQDDLDMDPSGRRVRPRVAISSQSWIMPLATERERAQKLAQDCENVGAMASKSRSPDSGVILTPRGHGPTRVRVFTDGARMRR